MDRAAEAYARYYEFVAPGAGEALRRSYAEGGMTALVRTVIDGTKQASKTQYVSPAMIGFPFASIGEADSAITWLERAYRERAYRISVSAVALYCEPIHDDPRFIDLLQRMSLDHVRPSYARN